MLLHRYKRMPVNTPAVLNTFIIHVSLPALMLTGGLGKYVIRRAVPAWLKWPGVLCCSRRSSHWYWHCC
jgi:hypothetical protein